MHSETRRKRPSGKRCVAGAALLCWLPALPSFTAHAQTQPLFTEWSGASFKPSEGLIKLDVEVRDAAGRPVAGLDAKDFTILDQGPITQATPSNPMKGQPVKIVSFHDIDLDDLPDLDDENPPPAADEDIQIILVVDRINQSGDELASVQNAVEAFLRQDGGHLLHKVSIYWPTTDGFYATAQPSQDGNELANEVALRKYPRRVWPEEFTTTYYRRNGPFPIYANQLCLNALGSIVLEQRRKPGKKLVFWFGTGWPSTTGINSFAQMTEYSTRMREARVALYQVDAWSKPGASLGYQQYLPGAKSVADEFPEYLGPAVLAAQSGGGILTSSGNVTATMNKVIDEAGVYYRLTFDPAHTDTADAFHALHLSLRDATLTARTLTGYYDEPSYFDLPSEDSRLVSIKQLEQILEKARGHWNGEFDPPDPPSLAASSPPNAKLKTPDLAAQRAMMSRTVDYLAKTIPKLPNFYATRTTVRYARKEPDDEVSWKVAKGNDRLRKASSEIETVLYQNGRERIDAVTTRKKGRLKSEAGLETKGTFGPILSMVILDAAKGDLTWSRWEQEPNRNKAVFRYSVPMQKSHYKVSFCCLTDMDGGAAIDQTVGYHGELTIDAENGEILGLTTEADLEPRLPLLRADILVTYGPVQIGGSTYICPIRSLAISRKRSLIQLHEWGETLRTFGPFITLVNEVTFGDYHMFHSESHMVTGFTPSAETPSEPQKPR